jgi:hypothetical protein
MFDIGPFLKKGKQALGSDADAVVAEGDCTFSRSCHIDEAYKERDPNGSRWDYWLEYKRGRKKYIVWIEVHPAQSTSTVGDIERKAYWLSSKLSEIPTTYHGSPLRKYWIPTAGVAVLKRDTNAGRRLAKVGVVLASKPLRLR